MVWISNVPQGPPVEGLVSPRGTTGGFLGRGHPRGAPLKGSWSPALPCLSASWPPREDRSSRHTLLPGGPASTGPGHGAVCSWTGASGTKRPAGPLFLSHCFITATRSQRTQHPGCCAGSLAGADGEPTMASGRVGPRKGICARLRGDSGLLTALLGLRLPAADLRTRRSPRPHGQRLVIKLCARTCL